MPQFPYAKLKISRNGGALQTGGIVAEFGDSVVLSSEDSAHPQAFRFEIYSHPDSFTCPAGWSTDVDGMTYYYAGGATAPAFTLPASHGDWGDLLLRLTIDGGDPGTSGLPSSQFIDESTALRLVSDAGVTDVAYLGAKQFSAKGPTGDLQAALRLLAVGLGVGFGTASIADHAVTYAKLQQVAAQSIIGNPTGSLADAQAVGVTGGIEFSGSNIQRSALTGDVTAAAGSGATSIVAHAVTFDKAQQIAVGLVGNDTGTADQKLITLGAGLAFSGGALTLAAAGITLASLETVADQRVIGNVSGGAASPIALTATQVTAFLNVATTTLKGLVPAPTSATGKFLKDDLTWSTPAGSFTSPSDPGDDNKIAYADGGAIAYASAITTDGTYLAFGAPLTSTALERVVHGAYILAGDDHTPTNPVPLLRWGTVANDVLYVGSNSSDAGKAMGVRWGVHTAGAFQWEVNSVAVGFHDSTGLSVTTFATTGTVGSAFKITDAAHTALTAATERSSVVFDLAQTRTWATGALTTQRALRVAAPTIAFAGASTVGTAATVAISAAPTAGTNATITQALALWLESGGIGYGSSAALTGLNRYAQNALCSVGRSSTDTDINLLRWGVTATDELALGDDGAASLLLSATTAVSIRLGTAVKWGFSTTQLDAHGNNIVNLLALNGTRVANGVIGTPLTDADQVLSIDGGSVYEQTSAPTANRTKRLSNVGTGLTNKHVISIRRYTTDSFTLTIADEAGNELYTFPPGAKGQADFRFNTAAPNKFEHIGHIPLS